MGKIKAILFDLDGVLVDSEPLHFEAHRSALAQQGIDITKEDYIQYGVSGGMRSFYEMMQIKYHKKISVDLVRKVKKETYGELIKEIKIFDGVLEVLENLHGKYRLTVVSNTHLEYIHKTLNHVGIEKYFDFLSSSKELERGKPFPDVYFDSLKKLGFDADQCIAIEDSFSGLTAAKSAGIKCVAIPNEFTAKQDLSAADAVIENIKEVNEELIENL